VLSSELLGYQDSNLD